MYNSNNNCFCKGEAQFVNACGTIRKRGHPVSPATPNRMLAVLVTERGAIIGRISCCGEGSAALLALGRGGNCLYNLVILNVSVYS